MERHRFSIEKEAVLIGYARVSTDDQSLNLQRDALSAAGCVHIFEEKLSGRSRRRAGLDQALAQIGTGDTIVVWRLDRLGRNFRDLVDIADDLRQRGANLISLSEGIDTSSSVGEVIFRLMSVFSEFERHIIVERTIAGIAAARARGQVLGRKPKLDAVQLAEALRAVSGGEPVESVAQRYRVGRSTLFRNLRSFDKNAIP